MERFVEKKWGLENFRNFLILEFWKIIIIWRNETYQKSVPQ